MSNGLLRKRIQLGLIHVAVAMTLVPINSTLNRVMIKELAVSAALVAVLASLPYLFSPIQVAIGAFSDRNPIWGLKRTPYILLGLLLCVAGVVVSPHVAFLIARSFWAGVAVGVIAFCAWGMGYNLAAVSYLSLASELSGERERGRTIAVMFVMMITGIIFTAVTLSHLVDPYTQQALVHSFRIIGGAAMLLGILGLIKLEIPADHPGSKSVRYSWRQMIDTILGNQQAARFFWYLIILLAAILGQDVLLEPYAAEAFNMSVKATTRITSIWGVCVLSGLVIAGWLETRIAKKKTAAVGGWLATIGFIQITISGALVSLIGFYVGLILLGLGTGLSTVANLSLMLDMTMEGQVGLFVGAWGMANAISRLIGSILGGTVRDLVKHLSGNPVIAYGVVFAIMVVFLLISLFMLRLIDVDDFRAKAQKKSILERAALATDAS